MEEKSKNKLVDLAVAWGEYEAAVPEPDLRDFCRWYLAHTTNDHSWKTDPDEPGVPLNAHIGRMLGKLSRYASLYAKKAFAALELNNFEDLGYLWQTLEMGEPKKSELIYAMLSEFPSGVDIIKRLVQAGLLEEYPDPHDRRSKRVRATPKGRELAARSWPIADRVARVVVGDLSEAEKEVLLGLMNRLAHLHDSYYKQVRATTDFEQVYTLLVE
jgi:DNA-binding MarR family transcriptional regulator